MIILVISFDTSPKVPTFQIGIALFPGIFSYECAYVRDTHEISHRISFR